MPELPDPPWRVLAIADGHHYPHWWEQDTELSDTWWSNSATMDADSHELTPIPHDRNDPEALEIIKKAKEAT